MTHHVQKGAFFTSYRDGTHRVQKAAFFTSYRDGTHHVQKGAFFTSYVDGRHHVQKAAFNQSGILCRTSNCINYILYYTTELAQLFINL